MLYVCAPTFCRSIDGTEKKDTEGYVSQRGRIGCVNHNSVENLIFPQWFVFYILFNSRGLR